MATEETGNLDIQRQINELLEARATLISKQNDALRGQLQISEKIAELLEKGTKKSEGIDGMAASLNEAAGAAAKAASGVENVTTAVNEVAEKMPEVGAKGKKASTQLKDGFQKVKDVLGGVVGVVGSLIRSFTGVGGALLSIPMGILNSLQEEAADLAIESLERLLVKRKEKLRAHS